MDAYKPDVASVALKYFFIIINNIPYCNFQQYLSGEVYHKMAALASEQPVWYVDSVGYRNAFYTAINLMIRKSEFFFEHKEKLIKNTSIQEILGEKKD